MCKYTIDTNIYIHIYTHNINNPYFPIFDFTLTNTKPIYPQKKIQLVDLSTNKNTTFS